MTRNETRKLNVGGVAVGGGAAVTVQSMCNTDTRDVSAIRKRLSELTDAELDEAQRQLDAAKNG